MSENKLLSIAEIARQLEVPESTAHYWKSRFGQHLPSVGEGRQKRFYPEAVEVFTVIKEMLGAGHPAIEISQALTSQYPLNPSSVSHSVAIPHSAHVQNSMEPVLQIAQTMGTEIARSISSYLSSVSGQEPLHNENLTQVCQDMAQTHEQLTRQQEELNSLREEKQAMQEKLTIMEQELVRLRKDRREMEKYLLDKIAKMPS